MRSTGTFMPLRRFLHSRAEGRAGEHDAVGAARFAVAQQARSAGVESGRELAIGADVGIERFVEQVDHLRVGPQRLERLIDGGIASGVG